MAKRKITAADRAGTDADIADRIGTLAHRNIQTAEGKDYGGESAAVDTRSIIEASRRQDAQSQGGREVDDEQRARPDARHANPEAVRLRGVVPLAVFLPPAVLVPILEKVMNGYPLLDVQARDLVGHLRATETLAVDVGNSLAAFSLTEPHTADEARGQLVIAHAGFESASARYRQAVVEHEAKDAATADVKRKAVALLMAPKDEGGSELPVTRAKEEASTVPFYRAYLNDVDALRGARDVAGERFSIARNRLRTARVLCATFAGGDGGDDSLDDAEVHATASGEATFGQ